MATDLRTAVKRLVRKLRLDSVTSGNIAEEDAKVAIIDAMRFNRHTDFWFNRSKFTQFSQSGVNRYSLPVGYVSLIGRPVYKTSSAPGADVRVLEYRPSEWFAENHWTGTSNELTLNMGTPEFYSVDESTNELLILPIPAQSGEIIALDYLTDCEIPDYKHTPTGLEFYYKGTTVPLDDSFSNAWLEEAFDLIVSLAGHRLLTGEYGGQSDVESAQAYQSQWAAELMRLRGEYNKRASITRVRPHI